MFKNCYKKNILILIILLCFCTILFISNANWQIKLFANQYNVTDAPETDVDIPTTSFEDTNLYSSLLSAYNTFALNYNTTVSDEVLPTNVTTLSKLLFNSEKLSSYGCTETFDNLNLCDCGITSLNGFNLIKFNTLKLLNLSYNSIKRIDSTHFTRIVDTIEEINVSNNQISETYIASSQFSKLHTFIANNNQINSINLQRINNPNSELITTINLSNNCITSIDKIILPDTESHIHTFNLFLLNNMITNFSKSEDDIINYKLGLQGFNIYATTNPQKLTSLNEIKYYKTEIPNLTVEITNLSKNTTTTIVDSTAEPVTDLFNLLGFGNFSYKYKINNIDVNYNNEDYNTSFYTPLSFNIYPSKPTIKFEIDGNLIEFKDLDKLTKPAVAHLESIDENAKIFYSFDNKNFTEATSIDYDLTGTNNIYLYSSVNDMISDTVVYTINASNNFYISDLFLILIIVAFVIVLFFVVFPLVKKFT